MACNFTINELLHRYFSSILTANSTWKLSEQLFLRTPFSPRIPQLAASVKSSHWELFLEKRCSEMCFLWEVEVFSMVSWKRRPTGKIMDLFLAREHLDSLEKEHVLVSAKLTWKKRLTKEHSPAAVLVYYNKGCVSWYGKNMNKIKISIDFCTSLISPLISISPYLRMKPKTQSGNA